MEGTRTVQTAFRFSPELVSRLKRRARLERKSVNAYVEEAVEKALDSGNDPYTLLAAKLKEVKVPQDISPEIQALSSFKVEFTAEELVADDRLAYILGK
ncbi:MAG: toxin-antitoxin system HicB family antitoxin [Bacteroidales bacterium]|nr:toxin-antitoxin system HicB family antitoxin [Bacteroidales bacterium]